MPRFPDGARVCFIGDSLVAHNQTLPWIIEHYNKNFPAADIRFFNCGTAGGTYGSAIDFFEDDVLSHAPTHAVVAFGVNDSERWHLGNARGKNRLQRLKNAYEEYKRNTITYCDMILSRGIKLTLCTPAPYDEYTVSATESYKGGYSLILGYADFIRAFAKERGIELCDYHAFMSEMIETETEPVFSPDHIHPVAHGYFLMAKCFLLHQGLDIGEEQPIPEYFNEWRNTIEKLRVVFGAEHMVVCNYKMPLEEKMAMMEKRIEEENWGQAVFERFIRGFVAEKRNQDALYRKIDELYERDIHKHYLK